MIGLFLFAGRQGCVVFSGGLLRCISLYHLRPSCPAFICRSCLGLNEYENESPSSTYHFPSTFLHKNHPTQRLPDHRFPRPSQNSSLSKIL